jgi:subtilisin family serine protease
LALTNIITSMHNSGVVIVAAAGNDGTVGVTEYPTATRPTQSFPAVHDYVIGVGASDRVEGGNSRAACYSNRADIYAPGGNGSSDKCEAIYNRCAITVAGQMGQCTNGIVGLITKLPNSNHSGVAYWAGSSFATPLVSGLMASWISSATSGSDITKVDGSTEIIDVAAIRDKRYGTQATYGISTTVEEVQSPVTGSVLSDYYFLR